MLCEVICQVVDPSSPVNDELALIDAVADPVEPHVDRFGAALLDSVVDDARSARVVGLNGSRWLRMTHFFKNVSKHGSVFGIVEQCPQFGFSGRRKNRLHNGAEDMDSAIL